MRLVRVIGLTLGAVLLLSGLLRTRPSGAAAPAPAPVLPAAELHRAIPAPTARTGMRLARAAGIVVGIAAVAFALRGWTVDSTGPVLGADVAVVAVAPGELELTSPGAALRAHGLRAGGPAVAGGMTVRNITGAPVRVRIRALPSNRALDGALALSATARGQALASGPVGAQRAWSAHALRLAPGDSARIALRTQLLPATGESTQGLIADIALELDARPVSR